MISSLKNCFISTMFLCKSDLKYFNREIIEEINRIIHYSSWNCDIDYLLCFKGYHCQSDMPGGDLKLNLLV